MSNTVDKKHQQLVELEKELERQTGVKADLILGADESDGCHRDREEAAKRRAEWLKQQNSK